ncbi:hypothetical protein L1987_43245 [Smallanthus sonchifolius]|uniref:Uncharacterized protein n=1 Tax=Smallanthus sonchifolius TaxID=185202 RepID=A0ACB9GMC5_9ASTR|nr:hypothetical protein L1987_43245 [Smallanthus sonchifolius]
MGFLLKETKFEGSINLDKMGFGRWKLEIEPQFEMPMAPNHIIQTEGPIGIWSSSNPEIDGITCIKMETTKLSLISGCWRWSGRRWWCSTGADILVGM